MTGLKKEYEKYITSFVQSNPTVTRPTDIAKGILKSNPNLPIEDKQLIQLVFRYLKKNVVVPQKVEEKLIDYKIDIEARKQSAREKQLEKKYNMLLTDYESIAEALDSALLLKEATPRRVFLENVDPGKPGTAAAILQWSDWHVEEVVNPSTVMGLNKYNPEIAKQRVEKLVNNTVKVIRSQSGSIQLDLGVIWLGGDFITNYLREHDMQENAMTPIEAIIYAKELLIGAIEFMVAHSGFKKFLFICSRGNHPRLTPKMQPGNDYKMNLEALLYHMLEQHFASNEDIAFEIPESPIGLVDVYGRKIRYFHGHEIQYKDGVGGLSIPLNKKLQKWDSTIQADFNLMGHYHQCYKPLKTCMLNGSLVGYNAYALSLACSYEPAMQSFQILDQKRGFTMHTTIDCN